MTMEATFNFSNLKFASPPQHLFEIDQIVQSERREMVQKKVTFGQTINTQELDAQRRNVTLQMLYNKFSKTEEDEQQNSENSS